MAKKSPFLVWTPQFWSQDPKKPFHRAPLIGELITLKDTPPILSRFDPRWIPPAKKNTSWPLSPLYSIRIQKKFLAQTKRLRLISNHSMVASGVYYNPFQGSQGPQEGSEAKILTFWPKKVFTEMLISPEPDVPQGWLRCQNDRWPKGYAQDPSD